MIADEQRARIRRLFFAEHWKVGTIAAELGVHHDTVELRDRAEAIRRRSVGRALLRRSIRTCEFVRADARAVSAAARDAAVRDDPRARLHGQRVRAPSARAQSAPRLPTRGVLPAHRAAGRAGPGRLGLASERFASAAASALLSCFVMVLAWSRAIFARFTLDQTLESFLRCHVEAFERFGGVVRSVLYDNLKSVVLERQGDLIRFHPRILELAGHYHFAPTPVGIARGNEKGRVERRIRDLRESFFAARPFSSLDDLNQQLDSWIDRIAHARLVPGR